MPSAEETSVDNSNTEEVKENKKEKPVLHTTLVDAQPLYAGSQLNTSASNYFHLIPFTSATLYTSAHCQPLTHHPNPIFATAHLLTFFFPLSPPLSVSGQCLFETCDCRFVIGTSGTCNACNHPNLYHLVKPNRDDVHNRQLEADRQKQLFLKRKQREQREQQEKARAEAASQPVGPPANVWPCSVSGCDCGRFVAPVMAVAAAAAAGGGGEDGGGGGGGVTGRVESGGGNGSVSGSPRVQLGSAGSVGGDGGGSGASGGLLSPGGGSSGGGVGGAVDSKAALLPRVCRKCKHADMYHVKRADDDDKKKGAKGKAPAKKK